MRKLIRKSAGWIHASLMIAVIIPLFYSMGAESAVQKFPFVSSYKYYNLCHDRHIKLVYFRFLKYTHDVLGIHDNNPMRNFVCHY